MSRGLGVLSHSLLQPVDIVVDSREAAKAEWIVGELRRRGLRVAVVKLEAGDYYLLSSGPKPPVLVERKTVLDFANSIRDGRVWDQARRLVEAARGDGARPVLLLEGWLGLVEKKTRWSITAVLRVLDELALDWGVAVVPSPGREASAAWLAAKARSLGETGEKRVVRLRVEKKPMGVRERILYVAEGLAGPVTARRLLEKFKTLRRLANASLAELMSVEGVGEKRAREIYEVLNTPWEPDRDKRAGTRQQ